MNGITETNGVNGHKTEEVPQLSNGIDIHKPERVTEKPSGINGQKAEDVTKTLDGINADAFGNDGERIQALTAAYALVSRLETPWDFVLRLVMGQVITSTLELIRNRAKSYISPLSGRP